MKEKTLQADLSALLKELPPFVARNHPRFRELIGYSPRTIANAEAREQEEAERAKARAAIDELWKNTIGANPNHAYLLAKNVKAHGIRQSGDSLLVPVKDTEGNLHGLQFIGPDGKKQFTHGSQVAGNFHLLGEVRERLLIAEGYATGVTIHEITGHTVACAFNAGNLKPVAEALRAKMPEAVLIVCADDDYATEGNPGLTKATEAARAVNGLLAVPAFPGNRGPKDTDFNDLTLLAGPEAVRACIEGAKDVETVNIPKGQYFVDKGYLCRWKKTGDGNVPLRLANFWARISKEITEDNGLEIQHHYLISGNTGKRPLPPIEISAVQFATMNWLHRWGTDAIIEPGQSNRDYVRHAIQVASAETTLQQKVFTHTGGREIDGNPVYLTNAGGIGGKDVSVRLSPELSRYFLPLQPENEIEAIKTSMSFLEIGKWEITLPLLLSTYLASLTTLLNPMPNFSSYIYGMTGTFKTTLAILQLAHFGSFTGIEGLSNFDDSANSVEKRAFTLKDTLLVLDDYHPSHRRQDAQNKEHLAQRLIRAYSNRTARGRLNSDTSDKGRYTPRGFLQITGEEIISLQSTLARVLVIEIEPGDIDKAKLTELQYKAHLLPHAMAFFLLWVKENMDEIKGTFPERFRMLRDRATKDGEHRKLPEQTAFLAFVADLMANWLVVKGVLSDSEGTEFVSDA